MGIEIITGGTPFTGIPAVQPNADNLQILAWAAVQAFIAVDSVVRDSNRVLLSASIKWPDGAGGVYTTDTVSAANTIDAWHATYLGKTTKTVTQTAMTRDSNGAVAVQPTITIS